MVQKVSIKGNPAGKRMSNGALKARRAASWARGERRKTERRDENAAAKKRNADLRELRSQLRDDGDLVGAVELMTPWEAACAKRRANRFRVS